MQSAAFVRTKSDFIRLVQLGSTAESVILEFKQDYAERAIPKGALDREQRRRDGRKECARDIAQFANTDGGCLLVGVSETVSEIDGSRVAREVCPVRDIDDLCRWLEDAVAEFIVPSTLSPEVCPVALLEGTILAVNVPAFRHLVSVWDRQSHTSEHLRRTSRGKAWMNPDEMERHLMNGSRAAYLAVSDVLTRAELPHVIVVDGFWVQHGLPGQQPQRFSTAGPATIAGRSTESFTLRVPGETGDYAVEIPYGLVDQVWLGASGKIHMLLSHRLVLIGQVLEIGSRL